MNEKQVQQGDSLGILRDKLPEGCVARKPDGKRGWVFADGESGNWHSVTDTEDTMLLDAPDKSVWFVNNRKEAVGLKHDGPKPEHKITYYQPGIHQIGQVIEEDHLTGMVSQVND